MSGRPLLSDHHRRREIAVIAVLLVIVTGLVFAQSLTFDFLNFDDDEYVTQNPRVRSGLSWSNLAWAFNIGYAGNWHPLTWISHMIDVELFGLKPAGHHFCNVFLHLLSALLLFRIFLEMTGEPKKSGFVALFFAVHPLHVESVAWVAERKDVLSGLLAMMTIWAYIRYAKRPRPGSYILVCAAFLLGLMAKPMLVSLPFLLFLLDIWPFKRHISPSQASRPPNSAQWRPLLLEKIPLLLFAAISSVLTLAAQKKGEAVGSLAVYSLPERLANALSSLWIYLGRAIWPRKLAAYYPYPREFFPVRTLAALVLMSGLTFLAWRLFRRRPFLLVGWLWFLITLIPVIGLVQVGAQAMADRYMYLPLIGISLIMAWGLSDAVTWLLSRSPFIGRTSCLWPGLTAFYVMFLGVLAFQQAQTWANSRTLWEHALAVTKANPVAHSKLADYMKGQGLREEAVRHYQEALAINPRYAEAHNNLGTLLLEQGELDQAAAHFAKALQFAPRLAEAYNNLAVVFNRRGQTQAAMSYFQEALRINENYAEAHHNLASLLGKQGKYNEAVVHDLRAVELRPEYIEAHHNLALSYYYLGEYEKAWQEVRRCQELGGTFPADFLRALTDKSSPSLR